MHKNGSRLDLIRIQIKFVDIASVENGLSCNCICLICGTSLIARQGQNKKWHF
ncbi:hypothetical protein TRKP33_p0179 (plasmid) [Klebsiella pneumoniae]|nr:hypothetical protein TRKP33_p0179 [Klebsiella pneumoniae]